MKTLSVQPIIWLFLLVCSHASVIELTEARFSNLTKNTEYTLVMYYDPTNKECKRFIPKYERMSATYDKITFARINSEKYIDIADEQEIQMYPTIELFVWGVPIRFFEQLSIKLLKEWLDSALAKEPLNTTTEEETSKTDYEIYFSAPEGSIIDKLLRGITKKHQDLRIHKVKPDFAKVLHSKFKIAGVANPGNSLFCRREHDNYAVFYNETTLTPEELEKWIIETEFPDVSVFNKKVMVWLHKEYIPLMVFFYDSTTVNSQWISEFKKAASVNKGMLLSVLADIQQDNVKVLAQNHGVPSIPQLMILSPGVPVKRYLCKKSLNNVDQKMLEHCAVRFDHKKLKRFYKSEEPRNSPDRNVYYVVGKKYRKQVFDNFEHYTLVFFYDRTKEKTLEVFKQFAEKVGELKKFRFAMFNMEKNEFKHTFHLYPGVFVLYSPKTDMISEYEPSEVTGDKLLSFLEDKIPDAVFGGLNKAYKREIDL